MPTVAWISIAPVKGLALAHPQEVLIGPRGIETDRRFHLIDSSGRLVNGKRAGTLVQLQAAYDGLHLSIAGPTGDEVSETVQLGEPVETNFYGRSVRGRLVRGEFARFVSEHAGMDLRLVMPDRSGEGVDRGGSGAVSLLSSAALAELGDTALDARRFRMTFGIDGIEAYEEDGWVGSAVRVGEATVRIDGNVGRCLITGQQPDTGLPDFDTLGALRATRRGVPTTEPLPFGVHASVVEPGAVRLGDPIETMNVQRGPL